MKMRNPVAVLISDIHFTPSTLELATSALTQALELSEKLTVPIIVSGDILDSKAIIRAEVANRLIAIFSAVKSDVYTPYILVGNHDLISEKGKEHSLNFLSPWCHIIDKPTELDYLGLGSLKLIPYTNSVEELTAYLDTCSTGDTLIMHQGVESAYMGEYVQDKTSLPKEAYARFRVISGHYHRAQDIKCGRPRKDAVGLFSYIGTPYTITFAEAHDGPKGFQVLYSDGLLKQVPTNLRSHRIYDLTVQELKACMKGWTKEAFHSNDLIWLKVVGSYSELKKLDKQEIGNSLFGHSNFKLDLIYTDREKLESKAEIMSDGQILDSLIDNTEETAENKIALKKLWKDICA